MAIVVIVIWSVYSSSKNDTAIQSATTALNTVTSNDTADATQQAIQEFKDAYKNSNNNADKLTILKNLASTYNSSGDTADALSTYKEALAYTSSDTSDYYLISAELAEIQTPPDPSTALSDIQQANQLDPNDYQILNELGLFYLDSDSLWTTYDDNAKALQYIKESYDLQDNDISTENLAIAYYFNNDYKQSISLLLPLNLTTHSEMALYLGEDYLGENDNKDATFYFQKAVDLGVQVPQEVTNYLNNQ